MNIAVKTPWHLWAVGIDGDISTASLKAVVSAINRAIR